MSAVLEVHFVVAFLVVLCAVLLSWNDLGRRVVNAVAALQFLVGVALAGVMGASHVTLPPVIVSHAFSAILLMASYGLAMFFAKRGRRPLAMGLSVLGLVFVFMTFYLGLHMVGKA